VKFVRKYLLLFFVSIGGSLFSQDTNQVREKYFYFGGNTSPYGFGSNLGWNYGKVKSEINICSFLLIHKVGAQSKFYFPIIKEKLNVGVGIDYSLVRYPSIYGFFNAEWYNVHAVSPLFELELLTSLTIRRKVLTSFFINYAPHYPRYYSSLDFRLDLDPEHLILINFGTRIKFGQSRVKENNTKYRSSKN
jgi:hypothetical protein